jgi:hypothetical protein
MSQVYVLNISAGSNVYYNFVIWMLQVFHWLYTCVASVCFNCFKCMLQVFHLDIIYVAVAIYVRCNCVFQMFQLFHLNVACFSPNVVDVAAAIMYVASVYSKCFTYFRHIL